MRQRRFDPQGGSLKFLAQLQYMRESLRWMHLRCSWQRNRGLSHHLSSWRHARLRGRAWHQLPCRCLQLHGSARQALTAELHEAQCGKGLLLLGLRLHGPHRRGLAATHALPLHCQQCLQRCLRTSCRSLTNNMLMHVLHIPERQVHAASHQGIDQYQVFGLPTWASDPSAV